VLDTPGLAALGREPGARLRRHCTFIGARRAQKLLIETLVKRPARGEPSSSGSRRFADIRSRGHRSLSSRRSGPGTTLLHRLLAQDPAHRTVRLWEALQAPTGRARCSAGTPRYFEQDYRVEIARRYLQRVRATHP
jgi:hypothetical protein